MQASAVFRYTFAAGVTVAALGPAAASPIGAWDYQSTAKVCSIGTTGSPGKLIMMSTASGADGVLVVPDDQSLISPDHDYPLKVTLNTSFGPSEFDMAGSAITFGGAKVLVVQIKAGVITAAEPDGFALHIKMNDKVLFDKDMHGSKAAFTAFLNCSKTFAK